MRKNCFMLQWTWTVNRDRQLDFARRRCLVCDWWPSIMVSGSGKGKTRYQCRACGSLHTRNRRDLLKWVLKLAFYSALWMRRSRRRAERLMALHALSIRGVTTPDIREIIIRKAGLW